MSRWPRTLFAGYALLVIVAIVRSLWPFSSNLAKQWMNSPAEIADFGPIQSLSALEKPAALSSSSNAVAATSAPLTEHGETEIFFNLPGSPDKQDLIRAFAIENHNVYFLTAGTVYASDGAGQIRWSFRLSEASLGGASFSFSSGLVFVASRNGKIYSLEKSSGRLRWLYQLARPPAELHAAVAEDALIVSVTAGESTTLRAFAAASGATLWRSEVTTASVAAGLTSSSQQIFIFGASAFEILDAATGRTISKKMFELEVVAAVYSAKLNLVIGKFNDGEYRGVDVSSGKTLWKRRLPEATSNWLSEVVEDKQRAGFWVRSEGGGLLFLNASNGGELKRLQSKHPLGSFGIADLDSVVISRSDRAGLVRIR